MYRYFSCSHGGIISQDCSFFVEDAGRCVSQNIRENDKFFVNKKHKITYYIIRKKMLRGSFFENIFSSTDTGS